MITIATIDQARQAVDDLLDRYDYRPVTWRGDPLTADTYPALLGDLVHDPQLAKVLAAALAPLGYRFTVSTGRLVVVPITSAPPDVGAAKDAVNRWLTCNSYPPVYWCKVPPATGRPQRPVPLAAAHVHVGLSYDLAHDEGVAQCLANVLHPLGLRFATVGDFVDLHAL